jgi:hypothetical protein
VSTSHECPADGCTRRVSQDMLMCRNHWFMVPKPLQRAVWDAYYGPGPGSLPHFEVITAAIDAVNKKLAEKRSAS